MTRSGRLITPLVQVHRLLLHVYKCWLNNRSINLVILDIIINSSPIIIWLILFNSVHLIPNSLKPNINVRFAMRLDHYMFNSIIGSITTILCLLLISYLVMDKWFRQRQDDDNITINQVDDKNLDIYPYNNYHHDHHQHNLNKSKWQYLPIIVIATSWFVLKLIDWFKDPLTKFKNIVAMIIYIFGHFLIIPIMIDYLYLFQSPGMLKKFIFILGLQNITIFLIHLIFPNVPPLYIQYYGENKIPSYDAPGYSEGLTRIDSKLNFILNYLIIYVKSIEFGIIPSLHSSIAVLIILFQSYLTKSNIIKLSLLGCLCLQFWSSIYLEHHWKLDILVSIIFSSGFFLMIKQDLDDLNDRFIKNYKINYNGTTMGMRLFNNTRIEKYFNPM